MHPRIELEYNSEDFCDRAVIIKQISDKLIDLHADAKRSRCILIEGPAKRGKTWLLQDIQRRAPQHTEHPTDVCFFRGSELPQALKDAEAYWRRMAARLWLVIRDQIAAPQPPFDTLSGDADEENISQSLGGHPLSVLLGAISRQMDSASSLAILLLVFDGMDEVDTEVLGAFEREFLAPLFQNTRFRLLASRRVDSISQRWRDFVIKSQTQTMPLDGFDRSEAENDETHIKQIEGILAGSNPPLTFYALRRSLGSEYHWSNPGANLFLADCARANGGSIAKEHIRECLKQLIKPARPLPPPTWDEPTVYDEIERMVQYHNDIDKGVPRHQLNTVLDGSIDKVRDEFLGHLQDRGIGHFEKGGNYIMYPEFAELFRELHKDSREQTIPI